MVKVCNSGLFVGVAYSEKTPRERRLASTRDAEALGEYFGGAGRGDEERWRLLTESDGEPPKRLDVLMAFRGFASGVANGSAGVLFFSGHGEISERGLELKCYDTLDGFVEDSAVGLVEMMRILGSRGCDDVSFLVILDCCREKKLEFRREPLPANVCVIYGCLEGEVAVQDSDGGVLTQCVLGALRSTRGQYLTVRALHRRARQMALRYRPARMSQFEVVGSSLDEIGVALGGGGGQYVEAQKDEPRVYLRFSPRNQREYDDAFWRSKVAVLQWYGLTQAPWGGSGFFERYFWVRDTVDTVVCGVRMPSDGFRWNASEFLCHLVDALGDAPATLVFRWRGSVRVGEVRWIRNIVGGDWREVGAGVGTYMLSWEESIGGARFLGSASLTGGPESEVVVRCDTPENSALPLSCFRRTLDDVYEGFCAVRAGVGEG